MSAIPATPLKIAYLDCPTGISGDMCLGALVNAGVPLEYLTEQLLRLGISAEYQLRAEFVHRNGQQATKIHVTLTPQEIATAHSHDHPHPHSHDHSHSPSPHSHPHDHTHSHSLSLPHSHPHPHPHSPTRHLPEIQQLIQTAHLPDRVTAWSLAIFQRLAAAEGAVHGIAPEQVHFHEVGATDAIVDIVGTCLGLDYLGIDRLYCSALPIGGGTVWAAHGRLPVPAPAVLKLFELGEVPLYSNGIEQELVTPTGAAIATTLACQFGAPPKLRLQKVGLGAGGKDLPIPNILRLWIGTTEAIGGPASPVTASAQPGINPMGIAPASNGNQLGSIEPTPSEPAVSLPDAGSPDACLPETFLQETVTVLETQIDDLNPQAIGYVMEALLTAGALDVFTQAIGMKKSRPGILLTVICRPGQRPACEAILFRETTTLGIRRTTQRRSLLARSIESVDTGYGSARVKVARHPQGQVINVQPEYEDCAQIAREQQLPWREVHRRALQTWYDCTKLNSEEG